MFIPFWLSGQTIAGGSMDAGTALVWNCGGATIVEVDQVTTYGGAGTNFVGEIDDLVGLCQTVTGFAAGALYELRFLSSKNTACGTIAQQSFDVVITGGVPTFSVAKTNAVFSLDPEVYCFVATAASHTFTWMNTTGAGPGFDPACGAVVDEIHLVSLGQSSANFTFADFCENSATAPVITGSAGGTFAFNPNLLDGAGIHSATGIITGGVPGTTYSVEYTTNVLCQISQIETVTVIENPTIQNLNFTCALDLATYVVTFDIVDGDQATYNVVGNTGTITGNTFTSDPIASEGNYDFTVNDGNNCSTDNIMGTYSCTCPVGATLSGDISFCPGGVGDLMIDFTGPSPWTYIVAVDLFNLATTTTIDNPEILSPSSGGSYTLISVTNGSGCIGSVSGNASVTEYTSPVIDNVVETCSTDQLTYTVTFDVTGGDPTTYNNTGDPGTFTGSTFTSDPIAAGAIYDFTVNDVNNCATDNVGGTFNCSCTVFAAISGNISVCPGANGDLAVAFIGTGPWTFVHAINGVDQDPMTTSNNPYTLSTSPPGSYTLTSVQDFYCAGSVVGVATVAEHTSPTISNVVETCDANPATYTVSFDITGGDPATYNIAGNTGTLTGNSFTSDPILDGEFYNFTVNDGNNCATDNITGNLVCNCLASATLSGDFGICQGGFGDLTIVFTGTDPWTFNINLDGVPLVVTTTSDNPLILVASNAGLYELVDVMDGTGCFGTVSGTATVTPFTSPVISNVVETCATDALTYTVTFDITDGDPTTFDHTGNPGTFTGNTFMSDPIAAGANYDFTVFDANNCGDDNVNGTFNCVCDALGILSGSATICPGTNGDLIVGFGGTGPWSFVYAVGGIDQPGVGPTPDNPYIISTSMSGNYTLTSVEDVNCSGAVLTIGLVTVTEYTNPVISNVVETCSLDQLTYVVTFDITGGDVATYAHIGDLGTITGNSFESDPISSGANYDFTVNDANNCAADNVSGSFNCTCSATATLSGDIGVCPGVDGGLIIDFTGTGSWTFVHAIAGVDQLPITTSDNPYTLLTSTVGSYTLSSMSDANCVGSVSGAGTVTVYTDIVISNVVETPALDQLTYSVTFDVTGGDAGTYTDAGGNSGVFSGNAFTSDPINCGDNYNFIISDVNDCNPATINGVLNCFCAATATLSGNINICPGVCGDLTIDFTGTGPWTFDYSINGGLSTTIPPTSDNPYILSSCSPGTYTLIEMSDLNCVGSVFGNGIVTEYTNPIISNVVETCSLDQLTYVVTFDITGGDVATYAHIGDLGTITGNSFESDPISSGANYDFTVNDANNCAADNVSGSFNCTCSATATLSGDIGVCPGVDGGLIIDFTGTGSWTFVHAIAGVDQLPITTSDNPYTLLTSTVGSYTLSSMSDANCVGSVSGAGTVTVYTDIVISNVVETPALDQLTYSVTFDVTGGDAGTYTDAGGNSGVFSGNAFTSDPINCGDNYNFIISDVNDCNPATINGVLNCFCAATATLSGNINICPGVCGDLTIDFTGTGPWTFDYSINGGLSTTIPPTSDNPYILSSCSPGTYTLIEMSDLNCVGSVFGNGIVTEYTNPIISNVVETCSLDQLTYVVTFDITGGDVGTYTHIGDIGTITGNSFESDPIASGANYDFTVNDDNNCAADNVSGSFNCTCAATASLSGDIGVCPGLDGGLTIDFTGTGPWTFVYAIGGFAQPQLPATFDNPYTLLTSTVGAYTLTSMFDANCVGSVSGAGTVTEYTDIVISNVVETCSLDQLTYTVTFDVAGGDVATYTDAGGDLGTFTGNSFESDPIISGVNYNFNISDVNNCNPATESGVFNCSCIATATLSGDIDVCPGVDGGLIIDFTGTGSWTFVHAIAGVDQLPITTSDNPYTLLTSAVGSYTLSSMSDANCVGSVFGSGTVTELTSPVISNVVETPALDQLTYTVTFDVTGGDAGTYTDSGSNSGVFTGNAFTSDPINCGDNYNFIISDVNDCNPATINGVLNCFCVATATLSGDIDICPGICGDLTIDFTGPGPWTFDYSINGGLSTTIPPTFDNPYILSACSPGTYTLTTMSDVNCVGSGLGTATVTELTSPVISNVVVLCSADLLTYTVTFNVTGGDPTSYINNGTSSPGTFAGNTFTSGPIGSLVPYNFIIDDINSCSPDILNGIGDCTCYVTGSISGDNEICEGESAQITFDLFDSGPVVLSWNLTYALNNVPQPTITGITTSPYVITVTEPGLYTIETISTSFCTGTTSGSATIIVNPLPTAFINGDFAICAGDQQFIPVVFTGTGPWSFNYTVDGILQTPVPLTAPLALYEITGTLEGVYLITDVTDSNGCSNTGMGVANLNFLSDLVVTFPNDPGICIGESATIFADANNTQAYPYDYIWSSTNLVSVDDSIAVYNPLTSTDVQVTVSDGCNTELYTISIVVNDLPTVGISGAVTQCGADFINLVNTTPDNFVGNSCLWSINGDTINNCTSLDYFYDVGIHDVNLQVTSLEGCTDDATYLAHVIIRPQATADFSFSPDNITTTEPEVQFINQSSPDITFIEWNFGDLDVSTEENPIFVFPTEEGPGNYLTCLNVDNQFGCSDSICEIISISGEVVLLIPNTFTPDGDGVNEFFYPILIGADKEDYKFSIYNRIGRTVFETTDIEAKWDGSLRNPDYYCPDGMYTWQVLAKINGSAERKEFIGSVVIIR
ncbi:MAG: gliding motility-associated-like protein [Flavobacteriales bacterium]|jgi:gliding motility-associated-like protein